MLYNAIICGGGTAGLTAGIYLARAGLKTILFEKSFMGGQITYSPELENFPGLPSPISGAEFAMNMEKQALKFGTEIKYEEITEIKPYGEIKKIITNNGEYEGKNLILSMGASHKKLGLENEENLIGRGISYCATCDGAFFKNKITAVAGGGNTAVQDALYLSSICEKVYLIHRRDSLRADKYLQNKVLERDNIEIIYDAQVKKLIGEPLSEIEISIKEETKLLSVSALFIAIGLNPESNLLSEFEILENGYIKTDENMETSIKNVYAAGDIRSFDGKQLVFAAADGARAAMKIIDNLQK